MLSAVSFLFNTRSRWLLILAVIGTGQLFSMLGPASTLAVQNFERPAVHDEVPAVDAWTLTSKAFRQAAERVAPSLVTIESFGGVRAVSGRIGGIRKQGEGNTTGLLISTDGYLVTSTFNFIQSPPVITVITADGQRRVAQLLGRDETRNICLLKIEPFPGIIPAEFADESQIQVGQWAISVGVGYGDLNPAISTGIISAKNRIGGRAIQTDANISPANYGGPLLDIRGQVIGICVPLNPQSQAVAAGVEWYDSGIGFAIPLSNAAELIERLKRGERISPAFLGVRVSADPAGRGARIEEVVPNSPAAGIGLQASQVIRQLNQIPVSNIVELKNILNRFEAGMEVDITVWSPQHETSHESKVILGTLPPAADDIPLLEPPQIR